MAATGGIINIKNPKGVALSVTVTGTGTFLKSGGGTASFPEAITTDETFTTTSDGIFVVSVKYMGVEIAGTPDGTVSVGLKSGCELILSPSPDCGFDFEAKTIPLTTTEIASATNAINTTGKYVGKQIFNTTTGKPLWASATTAVGPWKDATGTTAHTPS